jgi:hypothetical protein
MVDRKLRGVSEYSIYIVFCPQDILKLVEKKCPGNFYIWGRVSQTNVVNVQTGTSLLATSFSG